MCSLSLRNPIAEIRTCPKDVERGPKPTGSECFFQGFVGRVAASGARTAHGTGLRFRIGRGQTVDLAADVVGFRRRIGKRDGAVESNPSLVCAPELLQECPARAMKIEIAVKLLGQN